MSSAVAQTNTQKTARKTEPLVGMGQTTVVTKPETTRAVLGSCVGLVLYHKRLGIGGLAHVVLPASEGRDGLPGKFADTALPHMLQSLAKLQAHSSGLVAKLTGGANMFGGNGPIQIGDSNAAALRAALNELKIPIVAEHLGGSKGRRVTLDAATGEVEIEIAGEETTTI